TPSEKEVMQVLETVNKKEIQPYIDKVSDQPLVSNVPTPATIIEQKDLSEIAVTQWKLSNGVRVILKPTDFKNDEILFTSYSPGGNSLIDDKDYIAGSTASTVIQEGGLSNFDQITLQKMLQGKIVSVFPFISELEEGLSGSSSPSDLETMFQLIYLYFTAPRIDSATYLAYQSRIRGILQNRSARPESAFEDTIQVTMAQHHPRRRPWTEAILDEMNLNKSFAFYKDRFSDASDFTFFLVGNFKLDEIKPLVLTYLGGLPSKHRQEQWRDIGVKPPKGMITKTIKKGLEPKSQVRIIFSGPFDWSRENRHAIQSMASVLRIKLREVMREEKGGVYGVGVSASSWQYPTKEYRLTISFGCAPERVDELVSAANEQIDSLRKYATTDIYITKVKEMQRREREVNLKENRFWLNSLNFYYSNEEDPLDILKYDQLIESVSKNLVQKTAQQYFIDTNFVKVVLFPQEK
ncbi:MAG TPA: insulinase family protein, partial [Bacteroidota bacterium]|nr:insulinase family protein [Bacteroidota bacterium]